MKGSTVLLLCLLLAGCASAKKAPSVPGPAAPPGLTVEEHALGPAGPGGLADLSQALAGRPEVRDKRRQWRELPAAGVEPAPLPFTPEQQQHVLRHPVRAGKAAVYVRFNEKWQIEVVADDQVVYTYTNPNALRMTDPGVLVKGFAVWDGQWVLETVEETVLVGGQSLNGRLGHAGIFGFHLIAGKPFFFFRQDGKVRVSYGGEVLPPQYDQVPHYGCCDTADFNPRASGQMMSFFGLRDGQWYSVNMGMYE